ncbi:unnamed protein product, partial [Ceratitis capitata]
FIRNQCSLYGQKTNWNAFESMVCTVIDPNTSLTSADEINAIIEQYYTCVQQAAGSSTPSHPFHWNGFRSVSDN